MKPCKAAVRMAFEHYIMQGQKRLRCGYTTGSCAALAAWAATTTLLTGVAPERAALLTPRGWRVEVAVEGAVRRAQSACAGVRKDAGDDPDVTDGALIMADVQHRQDGRIVVDGGQGVGRVTRSGLEQPVGAAAINRVPRQMIAQAVQQACEAAGHHGGMDICIRVPEGERLAEKTFNPRLGIEGGISILGTSGIVEPMSEAALLETIALDIRMAREAGHRSMILTPGNYGKDFLAQYPTLSALPQIRMANFIGDAIDQAVLCGMERVLLVGHLGKLVKLAAGIMNTHSRMADGRMELMALHAGLCGADSGQMRALLAQPTVDAALDMLEGWALRQQVMDSLMPAIQAALSRRAGEACLIGALIYSHAYGTLGITDEGQRLLEE